MFEFHVSRISRDNYEFDQSLFKFDGNVILANFLAAREFAQKINRKKNLVNFPEQAVKAGEINALGLIDEILHLVVHLYRQSINPTSRDFARNWAMRQSISKLSGASDTDSRRSDDQVGEREAICGNSRPHRPVRPVVMDAQLGST